MTLSDEEECTKWEKDECTLHRGIDELRYGENTYAFIYMYV